MPKNKNGSLKRLATLVQRLKRSGKLEDYDAIMQQQLEEGVIEETEMPAQGKEFYIPHKAVIRENAETTKMRIVYDASARAYDTAPSLNECLESGRPLQSQLWKVLVRGRFNAVAIAGDIRKAFLQVRILQKTEMRYDFIGSAARILSKYVHCGLHEHCLAWVRLPFFLGESLSITLTSAGLTTLIPYKRSNVGSTWTTC